MKLEPLGLRASHWKILHRPERFLKSDIKNKSPLAPETTHRQFVTALDILTRFKDRRGVLLADDVGLGKTTVAALIAWVFSRADKRVRILAPNETLMRRWAQELSDWACRLDEDAKLIKRGSPASLRSGAIQVATHAYARPDSPMECDLLIVDEAHRAKGEETQFSTNLRAIARKGRFLRLLILTATPFSIDIEELNRMLHLVGGQEAERTVRAFSKSLDGFFLGGRTRDPQRVADRLAERAEAAVDAMAEFVIRHGVDDLPLECSRIGNVDGWSIDVPDAGEGEIEALLRLDRALRIVRAREKIGSRATNDPRFHVGWHHFDAERSKLREKVLSLAATSRLPIERHLDAIDDFRRHAAPHPKLIAVAQAVIGIVSQNEKIVLFCHHHATARELVRHLGEVLPRHDNQPLPEPIWRQAWESLIDQSGFEFHIHKRFIDWLCSGHICNQVWHWLPNNIRSFSELAHVLRNRPPRSAHATETIAEAAQRLFVSLAASPSSRQILARSPSNLPGNDARRILAACESDGSFDPLIVHNQPDTLIAIFNSPFGPDALVVTDRLSEGVDLHRYCRHMIHYELDPSPMRTMQRNGRLRRVNCWAASTGLPIRIAYPAFGGTRDHRLVKIMHKRLEAFSLLLGGVRAIDQDTEQDEVETWRKEVLTIAAKRLARIAGKLRAKMYPKTK